MLRAMQVIRYCRTHIGRPYKLPSDCLISLNQFWLQPLNHFTFFLSSVLMQYTPSPPGGSRDCCTGRRTRRNKVFQISVSWMVSSQDSVLQSHLTLETLLEDVFLLLWVAYLVPPADEGFRLFVRWLLQRQKGQDQMSREQVHRLRIQYLPEQSDAILLLGGFKGLVWFSGCGTHGWVLFLCGRWELLDKCIKTGSHMWDWDDPWLLFQTLSV